MSKTKADLGGRGSFSCLANPKKSCKANPNSLASFPTEDGRSGKDLADSSSFKANSFEILSQRVATIVSSRVVSCFSKTSKSVLETAKFVICFLEVFFIYFLKVTIVFIIHEIYVAVKS